ncbi:hypothetical protein ACFOZY_06960 [Chungangia koreensis]|uniref:YtxH domain-containing protein n=1 Tax=Chungangia koreensis TaxID=752657 RepID=A0ABV8X4W0_9LACT
MNQSKLGKYMMYGAIAGACISLFDRRTREDLMRRTKSLSADVKFYSKNPDILKWKMQDRTEQLKSVYGQVTNDISYVQEKVQEMKDLTPQVKNLVMDTKDAFTESKEEYKTLIQQPQAPTEQIQMGN